MPLEKVERQRAKNKAGCFLCSRRRQRRKNMKRRFEIRELEQLDQCKWLTDRERAVFDLYYRRGWEIEAVAAELYLSRSTVKRTLNGIRSKQLSLK